MTVTTYYRWAFINSCGTVYGAVTTITVYPALVGGKIGSNATLCSGATQPAIIELIAPTGGLAPYSYSWEISYDKGATWTTIPGAINSTYTPTPEINPGMVDIYVFYRRWVTSSGGCGSVISNY